MRVKDVIASKASDAIFTISPTANVRELLDSLAEHNIGALIVSADGTSVAGIVSERDVVRQLRTEENLRDQAVETIMTEDVFTCSPADSISDLLGLMTDRRVRHMPVLDEDRLLAMISIGDVVKFRMEQLKFERDQLNDYVASAQ